MHKLIEYCCDELEDIERKVSKGQKLSMQELQYADTLAHMKKNLMKADEMSGESEYSGRGYSRKMSYDGGRSYGRGMSYGGDSYAEEDYVRPDGSYSRRRGRDSMGRYSSEGSVDDHTKEELRKLIDQM
jgi:hypothetical protein